MGYGSAWGRSWAGGVPSASRGRSGSVAGPSAHIQAKHPLRARIAVFVPDTRDDLQRVASPGEVMIYEVSAPSGASAGSSASTLVARKKAPLRGVQGSWGARAPGPTTDICHWCSQCRAFLGATGSIRVLRYADLCLAGYGGQGESSEHIVISCFLRDSIFCSEFVLCSELRQIRGHGGPGVLQRDASRRAMPAGTMSVRICAQRPQVARVCAKIRTISTELGTVMIDSVSAPSASRGQPLECLERLDVGGVFRRQDARNEGHRECRPDMGAPGLDCCAIWFDGRGGRPQNRRSREGLRRLNSLPSKSKL